MTGSIRTAFFTGTIPLDWQKKGRGHSLSSTKVIESLPLSRIRSRPLINALRLAVLEVSSSSQSGSQDALKEYEYNLAIWGRPRTVIVKIQCQGGFLYIAGCWRGGFVLVQARAVEKSAFSATLLLSTLSHLLLSPRPTLTLTCGQLQASEPVWKSLYSFNCTQSRKNTRGLL